MIVDKTGYYDNFKGFPTNKCTFISVQTIREHILELNKKISTLQKQLSRNTLPSFCSKEKKFKEIDNAKESINQKIKEIEEVIRKIKIKEPLMVSAIQTYFFNILKKIIVVYRALQQDNLRKHEIYDEYRVTETQLEDEELLQMTITRAAQIRQQIFQLTNTLLEVKMVLKNQTGMIDRIDYYFTRSNNYLNEANEEISRIPENYTKYKDMLIYAMIYFIAVILIMILMKAYKRADINKSR